MNANFVIDKKNILHLEHNGAVKCGISLDAVASLDTEQTQQEFVLCDICFKPGTAIFTGIATIVEPEDFDE